MVSQRGIEANLDKIQAILNMESPKNKSHRLVYELAAAWDAQNSAIRETTSQLETEIALLKRAVSGLPREGEVVTKVKVPEPKPFNGAKSAKGLENFLWDMEQYFKAARVLDQEKVIITSMYLSRDANLWWRTCVEDDADASRGKIDS
ncbi:hypothetical protein ACB092_11G021700 [Castanea dentata]